MVEEDIRATLAVWLLVELVQAKITFFMHVVRSRYYMFFTTQEKNKRSCVVFSFSITNGSPYFFLPQITPLKDQMGREMRLILLSKKLPSLSHH
ncbi:hypothetical protein AQUCO_02300024v1 [Aquilegia coerulea]|uniref:Uncharacterized protein n=1 Tax=Aquilegia coerulea TaxID=218851 RepID=A0A2G5DBW7_AQUCA|nr:hypothetical protein AQUCO_02300024v1 [Aquilegia coerulea]